MKRRGFVKALATVPAGAVALAQQPQPANTAPPVVTPPPIASPETSVPLEVAVADVAAEMRPHFFNADQLASLRKLCEILMPARPGHPGALEAGAPEFLDFLIGQSPADRQHIYTAGLDALNSQARKQFHKSFAELEAGQYDTLLAPLRDAWTYEPPSDPAARFLLEAKQDVRTATVNSHEFSSASAATSRRGFGGGIYWYPLD